MANVKNNEQQNDATFSHSQKTFFNIPSCRSCANLSALQRVFDVNRPVHLGGICATCAGANKFKPIGFKSRISKKTVAEPTPTKKK